MSRYGKVLTIKTLQQSLCAPTTRLHAHAGPPDSSALIAIKALGTTAILAALVPFQRQIPSTSSQQDDSSSPQSARRALLPWLNARTTNLLLASCELGLWSAIGSVSQAWGLSQIPATAAGFLIQFTAVITPTLSYLAGLPISKRTLIAIAVATVGTVLTATDGSAAAVGDALAGGAMLGKLAILLAAACYSLATFRISVLAPGASSHLLTACCEFGLASNMLLSSRACA